MIDKTILALDHMNREEIFSLLDKTASELSYVKIGMENFYRYGKPFIEEIYNKYQLEIFLDLKLHDIPKTVSRGIEALEGLKLKFLTVHLSGGSQMIEAALASAKKSLPGCKILGVSYLTSLDESNLKQNWGVTREEISDQFRLLFDLALATKIDGVVCSPLELEQVSNREKECDHQLLKVTPGIRFADQKSHDQKRVSTPEFAIDSGADFLVIGRAVTEAADPLMALAQLRK